jgi:hypothetical protein
VLDSTRAASSTAAVPEPSSLAPGSSAFTFMMSVTRLSMWPVMMTTSFGRSVPRWIPTALQTFVGVGVRGGFVTMSQVCKVSRPSALSWLSAQRTAAPIPRLGSVCDDKVCRVPKPTSFVTVCFIRSPLTGATIARSLASLPAFCARAGETADKAAAASKK